MNVIHLYFSPKDKNDASLVIQNTTKKYYVFIFCKIFTKVIAGNKLQ